MATLTPAGLTAAETEHYRRDGQVTPAWRLDDDSLAGLSRAVQELVAARADLRPDFLPLPHVPWSDDADALALARRFFDFVTRDDLLDLVEAVIGPDIVMWASAVFCKPAATGLEVPWHQDGQYWPLEPCETVTVWVALDHVAGDNGCMRFIPGSHRVGTLNHVTSERADLALNVMIDDPRLDPGSARDIELKPGQLSLHDAHLVHGSQPNTSGRRRAGYAIRYMPASAHYNRTLSRGAGSVNAPVEFAERPIWLVRGENRDARNDYRVGHTHW